jgi:hypothetical protein
MLFVEKFLSTGIWSTNYRGKIFADTALRRHNTSSTNILSKNFCRHDTSSTRHFVDTTHRRHDTLSTRHIVDTTLRRQNTSSINSDESVFSVESIFLATKSTANVRVRARVRARQSTANVRVRVRATQSTANVRVRVRATQSTPSMSANKKCIGLLILNSPVEELKGPQ